ncbi:S-adenosyl-L-methionine-dependent methyltransferase [Trema orientale]|uniref:S-adenosyl-L-methionine-dependent methyltransferase n=1 Tax=Trema orientale TaxID=63057 RepID=A0A2P5DVS0_TREOI|nr:S-adenosyl-L-methionine-dependent methyltransferase [Trema orientale]
MPLYFPTTREAKKIIEEEGSFSMQMLDILVKHFGETIINELFRRLIDIVTKSMAVGELGWLFP